MIDLIMPLYNSLDTLDKTMNSIANQSIVSDIKLYIIDDNSSDIYDEILDKYNKKINLEYHKLKENRGPGFAREYGIEHSNSEFIVFIDSDDIFSDSKSLEKLRKMIIEGSYDFVRSCFFKESSKLNDFELFDNDILNLHGKIYRRDFIIKNNIKFPYLYAEEDNAFNHLLMMYNPKTGYLNETTYMNLYNKNSLTSKNNCEYYDNYIYKFSMAFVYCLNEAIKGKCDNHNIGYYSLISLFVLYCKCCVVKKNYYKKVVVNDDIRRLLEIYKKYKRYLKDYDYRNAFNDEILFEYSKEILDVDISFNKFIELIDK